MSRILVIGGSGFIGRRICRAAVYANHDVRSVSRGGRPSDRSVDAAHRSSKKGNRSRLRDSDDTWADHVEWIAADLFDPVHWRDHLVGCDAVVHSVGITSEVSSEGVTFERLNGDSTILAALEAERAGVDSFVFISVSAKPPGLSKRYITAKRRAERGIKDLDLRAVALRPGPVYGKGNPHFPSIVSRALEILDQYDWLVSHLGPGRPLSVDTVAMTAFRAATDASIEGVLDISTIQDVRPIPG